MSRFSPQRRPSNCTLPKTVEVCEPRTLLTAFGGHVDEVPAIDGWGNNVFHPDWGSVDVELLRWAEADYEDGKGLPAGADRPSARAVSNEIASTNGSTPNARHLTDLLWVWGQFVDHDIDITEGADPLEDFGIPVTTGDDDFDPDSHGDEMIAMNRSVYQIDENGVRQQINQITAFLDGSVIYGSDEARAMELRTLNGGRLQVTPNAAFGDLLPYNVNGFPNAGGADNPALFLAGDVRANENAALTAMQTLWVREHNRIAEEISQQAPQLSDEDIYQEARAIVRAEMQAITYHEYLPALLGGDAIGPYRGYKPNVNPGITNEFSTAAYRFGHSLLSSTLLRLGAEGEEIANGPLPLQQAFFRPDQIANNGIDSLLRGAAANEAQELDNQVVDDVRNFLFGQPGSGGFDLASLNIQRGRDHGLASYNDTRIALGLEPATEFSEITSDLKVQNQLASLYDDVEDIDLWVGGLAEDHLHGSSMGETFTAIIADQFERLRDGDRFWYQNIFRGRQLRELESTTLADVIERNTEIDDLQESVFFAPDVFHVDLRSLNARDVTVQVKRDAVEIVDNRSRRVIASRGLDGLEQVVLVGSENRPEKITLGPLPQGVLSGGIEIQAGEGRADRLQIRGTNRAETISISSDEVSINGLLVQIGGIDRIQVQTHRGEDDVQIDEDVEIPINVNHGRGSRSHAVRHHGRGSRFHPAQHHGRGSRSHAVHHHFRDALESVFCSRDLLEGLLRGGNRHGRR